MTILADNLARVWEQIAQAATTVGRSAGEITLVAVTKRHPAETVREAIACGLSELGENYVREAEDKQSVLAGSAARWHLIGHLQSNKAKAAVQTFDLIQSVDTVSLARVLGRHAQAMGKTQDVLLQVHLGEEETKSGADPAQALEIAAEMSAIAGIQVCGLMGIAPAGTAPEPYFAQLRTLFDTLPPAQKRTLSMGMTHDFTSAIAHGATMIRIGTALFGPRTA